MTKAEEKRLAALAFLLRVYGVLKPPGAPVPRHVFGPEIQRMTHGGKPVGSKLPGYRPEILIEGAGVAVTSGPRETR